MGRPLTNRWIGVKHDPMTPVLIPRCNLNGTIGPCWILKQVGSNKYMVRSVDQPNTEGHVRLTNGTLDVPGTGCIRWETTHASGYVKNITDRKIKTFHGATIDWSISAPGDTVAYIRDNSLNQ